jgi:MSHA pilin protein MshA
MKKRHIGFTLIELVVVIVVLGIIASIAIPRFANISENARIASANGLLGAVRAASALVFAQAQVQGLTSSITMEGQTVNLSNGYPDATTTPGPGIVSALSAVAGYTITQTTAPPGAVIFQVQGAPTGSTCAVTYVGATATVGPTITVTTGGC